MKLVFFFWLSAARAFTVQPPPPQAANHVQSRRQETLAVGATTQQQRENVFDIVSFAAELDASLQIAQEALDAEVDFGDEFPTTLLLQEINDAFDYAYQVVDELQEERNDYKEQLETEETSTLIDADFILGEKSQEVVEYLSKGLLNANSFEDFVQERKEKSLQEKDATIEQAKLILSEKEQEALSLKQRIRQTGNKRLKSERTTKAVTVALDGSLLGCAIGLFAWAAIPEYLGDNVDPALPTFFMGGLMACLCIVLSTSDTIVAFAMEKVHFGVISKTVLAFVTSILRFLLSIPIATANNIAEKQNELNEEMEDYRRTRRRR